ncbi:MAG: carboxypeptidase-like regulatory domain-containing protein [Fermentimonas sp.]|jgi:hypothetical protein
MKNVSKILLFLCLLFAVQSFPASASQQNKPTYTIKGRVIGGDNNKPLVNASVSIEKENISTVTNQDGYFSLKVPNNYRNSNIIIRHLGYQNHSIPIVTLINKPNNNINLTPSAIELSEIQIISGDGSDLIKEALRRIPVNYPSNPNMMVAFYRESIKKGSKYISLVETVLDIYKASYSSFNKDQARIYIGRKATDISPRDTVLMKFQGGINDALMLDIAKNPGIVFGTDGSEYNFQIEGLININNKPHYQIAFAPLPNTEDILFRGTIFLEKESLAFARMEFNMNVENRKDAPGIFIRKKPQRMKVDVEHAKYVVNFTEDNGIWHFNYSSTDVEFRVRWTNRLFGLFATTYTIGSEMAITDRYQSHIEKFERKERIRSTDVIAEKVEYFQDPNFWGDYNVIEPDQEINNAIKRLSNKLLRRD